MNFESSVYVSEQLNRQMVSAAQELAVRAVTACGRQYDFDVDEALRMLGIVNAKVTHAKRIEGPSKKEKVIVAKAAFPMPYNGEFNDSCCFALRQNSGLYTQCQAVRKSGDFCKQCQVLADKTEGIPEYGTIQMRQAVGIFEYTDPKGRKPVAYTKVMKKYKIDQEKVLEEAGKFNVEINAEHFVVAEVDSKRGRPASKASEKAPKEPKGSKGRPKKAKKVLQIEGEGDDDDLFASLVADANNNSGEEAVIATKKTTESKKKVKSDEEKEAERLQKEAEKAEKEAIRLKEKQDKEAKLAFEKQEKDFKLAVEKAEREAKKESERLEREQKKVALELAKKEKEEKIAAAKATKTKKATEGKAVVAAAAAAATKESEQEEEPDVVKKIEFEGKKYLKSKKSGIIYDYNEYVKNSEQVMVGKWNDAKNNIEFAKSSEEEQEEEYDM
jgi:hypothetical protein